VSFSSAKPENASKAAAVPAFPALMHHPGSDAGRKRFNGGDTAGAQLLSSPPCSLVICQHSCTTGNQPVNLYDMFFHVWGQK